MHAFRSHNKVTPNLEASVSIYHCHSLYELGDQEQPSWEVQAHEVTMEMLAVVTEDGLRLGEPFPRSLIHALPHWSSEFIPGSTFSDQLEGRQDVVAHHSQSEHAP